MTETTTWQHPFGRTLKTERGIAGTVVGRAESIDNQGRVRQSYRLRHETAQWGEKERQWVWADQLREP